MIRKKKKVKLRKRVNVIEKNTYADHPATLTDSAFRFTLDVWIVAKWLQFKPKRAMDIGCAEGKIRDYIRNSTQNSRVPWLGVDLRDCSESWSKSFCEFVQCDILKEEFPEVCYDYEFIICSEVIEHFTLEDSELVFRKVLRCLAEDGVLVLTVPSPQPFDIYRESKRFGHFCSPKLERLVEIAEEEDCTLEESWTARFLGETRIAQVRTCIQEQFGDDGLALLDTITERYHQRVTCGLFAHLVTPPNSHIQAVFKRNS
jgi:SAM-dependent methyltransferase